MPQLKALSISIGAALVVAGLAVSASAQSSDEGNKDEAVSAEAGKDELICRTEKVIGSRAKKRRICLTKKQWAEVEYRGGKFSRALVESGRSGIRLDDF